MRTIVFKRVTRKLICSRRAGWLKVPVRIMAARVQKLIKLAAGQGFGFAGPVNATALAPNLMAYCCCKVPSGGQICEGRISCWVDGAVALDITQGGRTLFGLRIDRDGRTSRQGGRARLTTPEGELAAIGELLAKAENAVAARYAGGFPDSIDEAYILTRTGELIRGAGAGESPAGSASETIAAQRLIAALRSEGNLRGYVHVSSGWITDGPDKARRRRTLIFSAYGARVTRVRIYELKEVGGLMRPCRLVVVFKKFPARDGR